MTHQDIVDPWVIRFRDEAVPLIKDAFNPERILVFGSRAKNVQGEDSDLDVIIISEKFALIPFIKRYSLLFSLIKFPIHIDYICYTPEEFKNIQSTSVIIHDALSGPVIALA